MFYLVMRASSCTETKTLHRTRILAYTNRGDNNNNTEKTYAQIWADFFYRKRKHEKCVIYGASNATTTHISIMIYQFFLNWYKLMKWIWFTLPMNKLNCISLHFFSWWTLKGDSHRIIRTLSADDLFTSNECWIFPFLQLIVY